MPVGRSSREPVLRQEDVEEVLKGSCFSVRLGQDGWAQVGLWPVTLTTDKNYRLANWRIVTKHLATMTRTILHLLSLLATSTVKALTLPAPDGRYGTASSQTLLTDRSRQDPYAAAFGRSQFRQVVVSSFYPVALREDCIDYTTQYMPNATAAFYDKQFGAFGIPDATFASLQLAHCSAGDRRGLRNQQFPVVLFSPGLGNSRFIYSAMVQALASQGYIVVSIDHPYDADIVEFPDGSIALAANITTDAQIEAALNVRSSDVSFVVDELRSRQVSKHLSGNKVRMDQKQYAIYGHSLGGATAAEVASRDTRLIAAVNLDGTFFGSVVSCGATKPLLIVSHDGKNLTTDQSWTSTWEATRKITKVAVTIPGTAHGSYTDYPLIVDALDVPAEARDQFADLTGAVLGALLRDVVSGVVGHFLGYSQCRERMPLPKVDGTNLGGMRLLEKSEEARRCK
jgi:dienelactone hydrolase